MNHLPGAIQKLPHAFFNPGETILGEDEAAKRLYFLSSGSVEVVKGGVTIASISEPGAVFGDMAMLLGTAPTAAVRAAEPTELWVADAPEDFVLVNPEVMFYIAGILARRLDGMNRYLVDVKTQFKEEAGHLGMVDGVLDTLMNKHPRTIERRAPDGP